MTLKQESMQNTIPILVWPADALNPLQICKSLPGGYLGLSTSKKRGALPTYLYRVSLKPALIIMFIKLFTT